MNIGDLYFGLHADGTSLQRDVTKQAQMAGTTAATGFGAKFKSAFSKQNIGQGLIQGLGLAGGLKVFSAVDSALSSTVNWLGEAGQAAREEGVAVASLTQALEANVAGWDGNIEAVEEVIASRERLGFADDEQRQSLARLVAVTGDANKALDLQAQAMDLARLRGIDLSTASEIIGKVYGGNVGILSRYGIQLEKGTTATEALAEIQRRAAGQAEAFAETEQGAADAAAIAAENLQEDVGEILLPILKELAVLGRDVIIPFLRDIVKNVKQWAKENKPLLDALGKIAGVLGGTFFKALGMVFGAIGNMIGAVGQVIDLIGEFVGAVTGGAPKIGNAVGRIVGFFVAIPGRIAGFVGRVIGFFADIARRIVGFISDGVGKIVGFILSIPGKIGELIGKVGKVAGDAAAALLAPFVTVVEKIRELIGSVTGPPRTPQQHIDYHTKGVVPPKATDFRSADRRARGGPVLPSMPYLIGERGPELWVPSSRGHVVPTDDIGQIMSGESGGSFNPTVNIEGLIPYRDPFTIATELKRLREFVVVTPRR